MMARILIIVLAGIVVAALVGRAVARRRKAQVSEINKHPERLEQMLDETDDA